MCLSIKPVLVVFSMAMDLAWYSMGDVKWCGNSSQACWGTAQISSIGGR